MPLGTHVTAPHAQGKSGYVRGIGEDRATTLHTIQQSTLLFQPSFNHHESLWLEALMPKSSRISSETCMTQFQLVH